MFMLCTGYNPRKFKTDNTERVILIYYMIFQFTIIFYKSILYGLVVVAQRKHEVFEIVKIFPPLLSIKPFAWKWKNEGFPQVLTYRTPTIIYLEDSLTCQLA